MNHGKTTQSVDKSAGRVRRMFGQIAPRYDLANRLLSLGIDRRWRRRTVQLAPPDGTGPVLDVCTGTGDLALAYWRAGQKQIDVVGADFCRPMLGRGREKILAARAGNRIRLVEADALRLPFPNDRFQIVAVAFGLRNLCRTQPGLDELVRVCRPGGRVAVLEFSMPRGCFFGPVYRAYFRHVLPRLGQTLANNRLAAYNYLPASVGEFPQEEALVEMMRAAGLSRVECHRFTFGVVTLYVGEK